MKNLPDIMFLGVYIAFRAFVMSLGNRYWLGTALVYCQTTSHVPDSELITAASCDLFIYLFIDHNVCNPEVMT